jgi:signal transduction histidine kinase
MAAHSQDETDRPPPNNRGGGSAITGRLFRAAFLLYLIAAILITGGLVVQTYVSARSDLERELSIYRRTMEGALAGPLWALDLVEVQRISDGMVELPEVVGVRVLDHNSANELARAGDVPQDIGAGTPATDGDGWFDRAITASFFVVHAHAVGQDRVGHVTIYSSQFVIFERVRWHVALLLLTAVLNIAILWIIFNRVGRSILIRPLTALTEAARRTGFERLESVEFDPETARAAAGTEIEILHHAFNDMIEDLKRSRDSLAAANADLERRVAERTRLLEARSADAAAAASRVELSRRQVAAALDEAERAARTKSEFLALVSHELRTPLNSILGYSELIQREVQDNAKSVSAERVGAYAGAVHESGSHLLMLINDILDLSRIEAGRMQVVPEWIDTTATTRTIVELMRDPATKGRLSLESALDETTPMLKVDPRRYRQMLMNLLSNALKYTEPGGEIRIEATERQDGWLEIVVADTGVGMPASDIALALEPFGRAGDTSTRRFAGAGLGLPLVAQMMQLHGGRLALESEVGKGTRAILRFPPASVRGAMST